MPGLFSAKIREISLPEIPFSGGTLPVSDVNFLYGENGTGKTTLAGQIAEGQSVSFDAGYSAADSAVLRFDENYIETCFRVRDRVPGIFSLRAANRETAREISDLKERVRENRAWVSEYDRQIAEKQQERTELFETLKKQCWRNTVSFRKEFPLALRGSASSSAKVARAVLEVAVPEPVNPEEFRLLYQSAWEKSGGLCESISLPADLYAWRALGAEDCLRKRVFSSGSSEFAVFVRTLQAADWIREGREHLLPAAGDTCPFCGQPLPQDLDLRLAEVFDETYEQELAAMKKQFLAYRDEMNRIFRYFQRAEQAEVPGGDHGELPVHLEALRKVITENLARMKEKEAHPDREFTAEDITELLRALEQDVILLNRGIRQHNAVLDSQKEYQSISREKAWAHMAYLMREEVRTYRSALKRNEEQTALLARRKEELEPEQRRLLAGIREREQATANTREAMEEINRILQSSRYQGFSLREKEGASDLYEIVYGDGRIADHLSEGEYRMLAFLYFCQQAMNRSSAAEDGRQVLLVLDDPVNGLDLRGKKVAVSMLQKLAARCLGRAEQTDPETGGMIAQVFLMTHDLEFFRMLMTACDSDPVLSDGIAWYQMRRRGGVTEIQKK